MVIQKLFDSFGQVPTIMANRPFTCVQVPLQSVEIIYQKTKGKPDKATKTLWPVMFAPPLPALGYRWVARSGRYSLWERR